MNRLTLILAVLLASFNMHAQATFEKSVKRISDQIEVIHNEEKASLNIAVENINQKLENSEITTAEADDLKLIAASASAERISDRIAPLEEELQLLVKQKAEGKWVDSSEDDNKYESENVKIEWNIYPNRWSSKSPKLRKERRTTSQFVFAFGLNNLVSDGDLSTIENDQFSFGNSRFYEWGLTSKTRLLKQSSLLQFKYGLSLIYNNLRPANNTYFVKNDNQTVLATHPSELVKDAYFRHIQLVVPMHLEFDFTKKRMHDDRAILNSQRGIRVGIGGYAGIRTKTKQILEYRNNGLTTDETTKGDYNTNALVYGASGYIGYKDISLYAKYDMNTLFRNNSIDQNNISFGLRFDFN